MTNYTTKFSLGDHVYIVDSHRFERIVRCKPCHNTGKVIIGDEELICPKCNGRSTHTQYAGEKFYITEFDTVVGKIGIEEIEAGYYRREDEPNPKITYMVVATGVGSGTLWPEDKLFRSEEEAQQFCDQENGLLLPDETERGKSVIGQFGEVL
jgi:RNA polymerase subunit RPABC4/transcription elongation factor Spt4